MKLLDLFLALGVVPIVHITCTQVIGGGGQLSAVRALDGELQSVLMICLMFANTFLKDYAGEIRFEALGRGRLPPTCTEVQGQP